MAMVGNAIMLNKISQYGMIKVSFSGKWWGELGHLNTLFNIITTTKLGDW